MELEQVKSRFWATMYGEAIGDALGVGTEFMSKEEVMRVYPHGLSHYSQINGCHHRIEQGDWSDDTDMMLCLAQAIIDDGGAVNEYTIARKFREWAGSQRAVGCIGNLTYSIVFSPGYVRNPVPTAREVWEEGGRDNAPNGGLMRTAVMGLLGGSDADIARNAEAACRVTHYDPRCVGSCVIASEIIHHLVWNGKELSKDDILTIAGNYDGRIAHFVELAANPDIAALKLGAGRGIGYTLKCLSAMLWAYFNVERFERGLLEIVNEGGDADTNAAPACAVMGAKFGLEGIPGHYIQKLCNKDKFDLLVQQLWTVVNAQAD